MNAGWRGIFVGLAVTAILAAASHAGELLPTSPLYLYARWIESPTGRVSIRSVRQCVGNLLTRSTLENATPALEWIHQPVGLFVTAMKQNRVRACVGTLTPTANTLSEEIARQCRRLVGEDPRFPPLEAQELEQITFFLTFAGTPEPLADPDHVDVAREGLLAEWEGRQAVLLPGEARTGQWGIQFLRKQIRIPSDETPRFSRIPVVVIREARLQPDQAGR